MLEGWSKKMSRFALMLAGFAASCVALSIGCLAQYGGAGGWTVLGRLSEYKGCVAQARFVDGTIVRYGHDGISNQKFLNFSNLAWGGGDEGSPHDLTLNFGRNGSFSVEASFRYREGLPTFEIGGLNERFIDVFSAASSLAVLRRGVLLTRRPLSLSGTRKASRILEQCQRG
jgi:hypothetical protein